MNFGKFNFTLDASTFKNVAATASKHMETAAKKMETVSKQIAASDLGKQVQQAREKITEEYNATFSDMSAIFMPVSERLFVMDFPDNMKRERLAHKLNDEWRSEYLIFNMSERKYDTSLFTGEVVDVQFRGLPAPPLQLLVSLSMSARQWLASSDGHILVVHCFKGYTRSAIFLSCFLMQSSKAFSSTKDALTVVCQKLKIKESSILPSQWRYLEYFDRIICSDSITSQALKIARVAVHGTTETSALYLEIWNKGEKVRSVNEKEEGRDGDSMLFDLREALAEHPGHCDDMLVRIRCQDPEEEKPRTVLRFAFHCSFVENDFLHLSRRELDGAEDMNQNAFVDVIFDKCDIDTLDSEEQQVNFQRARMSRVSMEESASECDRRFDEELEALQKEIGVPHATQQASLEEMFNDLDDVINSEHEQHAPIDGRIRVDISTPRISDGADTAAASSSASSKNRIESSATPSPPPAALTAAKVSPPAAQGSNTASPVPAAPAVQVPPPTPAATMATPTVEAPAAEVQPSVKAATAASHAVAPPTAQSPPHARAATVAPSTVVAPVAQVPAPAAAEKATPRAVVNSTTQNPPAPPAAKVTHPEPAVTLTAPSASAAAKVPSPALASPTESNVVTPPPPPSVTSVVIPSPATAQAAIQAVTPAPAAPPTETLQSHIAEAPKVSPVDDIDDLDDFFDSLENM